MARRGETRKLKKYRYKGPGKHWINVPGGDGKVTRRCAKVGEMVELSDAAFAAFGDRFIDPDAPVPEEPDEERDPDDDEPNEQPGKDGGKQGGTPSQPRGGAQAAGRGRGK